MQVGLAPMEGVTGFPTRLWLHWASRPDAMTTPFLRVSRAQPESLPLLFAPELYELRGVLGYEVTPQLLAADPEGFLRASEMIGDHAPSGIELNCGCPCPTCIGKHAGSGILADPDAFAATTSRLAAHLGPRRFAVKMRLGYAADDEFATLLDCVSTLPLARLSIHGRTRADAYRGKARWQAVQRAATATSAPAWGSGDVVDLETFKAAIGTAPAAHGVMIGRGALRNPWIFDELRQGGRVTVTVDALGQALLAFSLVNELSLREPAQLIAKVSSGRLAAYCGTDGGRWEARTAQLASLVCGVPLVWRQSLAAGDLDEHKISSTTLGRLRFLWSQLRTSLPPAFGSPKIVRAKSVGEFFAAYALAAREAQSEGIEAVEIYAAPASDSASIA